VGTVVSPATTSGVTTATAASHHPDGSALRLPTAASDPGWDANQRARCPWQYLGGGPMIEQLRTKADETAIPVVAGDMTTARAPGSYALVYLVFNTISCLLTQSEQVACFRNAARRPAAGS
jgi:hypothetical protein